jgi:CBS domain-containing protein
MTSRDRPPIAPARDVAEFLHGHELFHAVPSAELEEIAQRCQVEGFAAGTVVLSPNQESPGPVRVVWRGAVDLLDQERPLDRLGEGELFGHPSMLSGLPPSFEVRAAVDTVCLRWTSCGTRRPGSGPWSSRSTTRA